MSPISESNPLIIVIVLSLICVALGVSMSLESMADMLNQWQREEYNHSYLIPLIAGFLFYQRLPKLKNETIDHAWIGVVAVALMIGVVLVGELSALYTIVQYGLIGVIAAVCVTALGFRNTMLMWAPLCYLLFMVPLPGFLLQNLSQYLQLVSSEIGVAVIRFFGISVYLEGNVIDLGIYQLQVVEACSGLRYLFPLSSFGFLIACLYQAPLWQRALVFLSTAPVTVLMNSFRIGVIGVLVEHWGIGQAEGFLHLFEGWIVFIACLGVLVAELYILHRLTNSDGSVLDRLDLTVPTAAEAAVSFRQGNAARAPLFAAIVLLLSAVVGFQSLESRVETFPERGKFLQFPLFHEDWIGREGAIDTEVLQTLKLTDYIMADYQHPEYALPVNFYVAYYESQRKGASVHSPRSCIPGGGWQIKSLDQVEVNSVPNSSLVPSRQALSVNRVVIQRGENRQLVYYWFQQRGRVLTNEYLVKWFLFWDSLNKNRTDGALVRIVVPVPDGYEMSEAESQLERFIVDFERLLPRYLPN